MKEQISQTYVWGTCFFNVVRKLALNQATL